MAARGEIREALAEFEEIQEDLFRSDNPVSVARRVLRPFARALARRGITRVLELEREAVVRHAAARAARPVAPGTVAHELAIFRRFLRWLHVEKLALEDLSVAVPRVTCGPRPLPKRILGEEEVAKLYRVTARAPFSARSLADRALLEVLYGGGLRRGEAAALEVRDLDLADGTLTVRMSKTGRGRIVPLPRKAQATLREYVREARPLFLRGLRAAEDPGRLFVEWGGRPLKTEEIGYRVRTLARRAKLGHLTPHALRHAIATHLVRRGVSVRIVQLFLGHACIKTTAIYTHLAPADLRGALEHAHPREQGQACARERRRSGLHAPRGSAKRRT